MTHYFCSRALAVFLLILILPIPSLEAQVSNDADSDGISDFTTVSASGTELTWTTDLSGGGEDEATLGSTTDKPALAQWETPGVPSIGIVQANGKSLDWKVLSGEIILKSSLGKPGDLYLAGGDYDGNGIADAAVVREGSKGYLWYFVLNMFSGEPESKGPIRFGKDGDRAFFMSYEGDGDWIGVFGPTKKNKARIKLRNIITRETRTIRGFPKSLTKKTRPRPFPVQQEDGTDLIAFAVPDKTDTTLQVYNTDGDLVANPTFPGLGITVVGDYTEAAGEEIGFQSTRDLKIYSIDEASVESRSVISGVLVDEIAVDPSGTE